MTKIQDHLLKSIHRQFTNYYSDFLSIADRAPELFRKGELDTRLQDDLLRVQLYRIAIDKSVAFAGRELGTELYDRKNWEGLRNQFKLEYGNELATTYFTSVMRKVFAQKGLSIEFEDDGIAHEQIESGEIVGVYPIENPDRLGATVLSMFNDSVFSGAFSKNISKDAEVIVDIVQDYLGKEDLPTSLEMAKPVFFRGKGAYLVGQIRCLAENLPLVICCVHLADEVKVDAVLVGYPATRSFLFSSTRSAFTVSTNHYQAVYSFLQQMYPGENPAYILDIIGFSHPAKVSLLQQLRKRIDEGEQFSYLGSGPIDFVFGVDGFPLVFKVIRRSSEDRQEIIHNFIKVHTIDRLGQVLDSLDYHNVQFDKHHFSDSLLARLEEEQPEDVVITSEHVFLKRVYLARRIIPVIEQVRLRGKREARQILLNVGWNIKHLAAMGFFPQSLGLRHFGITSWGRIVYLDNASLVDIGLFEFDDRGEASQDKDRHHVNPGHFEEELNIPQEHREIFRAIHGDLFTPRFWEEIKAQVLGGHYPEFFPYPSNFRLEQRKFHSSVLAELQRVSDSAEANQIHMAPRNLAVVDVELAGLSFLRLEVLGPSARVLVIEPIGPEIIAQLHHRFRDVTFDILQSESEVVESAGQWTPGIHGKLNALVQIRRYDYVIGYVNETFDEDFFRLARLKGFLLLSTGTHNIDVAAATKFYTVVTNAPGPTTTTVAEQNIGLILDSLFSRIVRYDSPADGFFHVMQEDNPMEEPLLLAQAMWFCFLQKTLRLEEMFSFGASELYVRTGVGERATVYHDQIGQNKEAGIQKSIGVRGLNEIGLYLIEFSVAHEISAIYLDENEYRELSSEKKERLDRCIAIQKQISQTEDLNIRIELVKSNEVFTLGDFTFNTLVEKHGESTSVILEKSIHIDINNLFVSGLQQLHSSSLGRITLGVQGLGRIGEAVAQRAISLGMSVLVYQRDPGRVKYQRKLGNLRELANDYNTSHGSALQIDYANDKESFFRGSNIITTLAATTEKTSGWVNQQGLKLLASKTWSSLRAIISAGKGLVDEDALLHFLKKYPKAEARLDVLVDEHEGGSYSKLVGAGGVQLPNLRVTGHTAAAVREVRKLKIYKALDNLRNLIDGRIPPNIVNNTLAQGREERVQSVVEIKGLRFFRMVVSSSRARVLVIEPLPAELVLHLQQQFGDISFDILLAESELIEVDGQWLPGINNCLNDIVSGGRYDYVLGYCNANFDDEFFRRAQLKGLVLFATATHHIDLEAASLMETTVTNSPGFTTVAVTEQNVGMVLDGLYGAYVYDSPMENAVRLDQITVGERERAGTIAQIMWFDLMRRALRLDAMYEFGSGDKYVRTGVRRDATVYHDQLGQYSEAGIHNSIGIIGLDEVGINLIELAIVHEFSTILVLEEEYVGLTDKQRKRLDDLVELTSQVSQTKPLNIEIRCVEPEDLMVATYTLKTPAAYKNEHLREIRTKSSIRVYGDEVYVDENRVFERSMIGLTFGVQGLGRIGEAVVQRALAFGANVLVCQRDPDRPKYQEKLERLRLLAENRENLFGRKIVLNYVQKEELFTGSNIVTTLAATTSQTRYWVDGKALEMLGRDAYGRVRVFVNAGKGLLKESDLATFLRENKDVEVRLDVLSDEQKGGAGQRFLDEEGRPLKNLRIAGHTAAAVPELRRLKILNALNNLRLHIDGLQPGNILKLKQVVNEC